MLRTRKAKLILAIITMVLLCIFVPPNVNGTRFRDRLAPALSSVLGRQVKIGQVRYRLLPRPGFDLYDFQVMDDPAFNAEPVLMCGKVTADLRLTSLWHGRLEIANLKLTDDAAPPSLNLVAGPSGSSWRFQSSFSWLHGDPWPLPSQRPRSESDRCRSGQLEVLLPDSAFAVPQLFVRR